MNCETQPKTLDRRFSLSLEDWADIFEIVDRRRNPEDGGCFILVKVLAMLLVSHGVDPDCLAVMSLRTDGILDHAWLTVNGLPLHAPYRVPEDFQLRIEREGRPDWILTAMLQKALVPKSRLDLPAGRQVCYNFD